MPIIDIGSMYTPDECFGFLVNSVGSHKVDSLAIYLHWHEENHVELLANSIEDLIRKIVMAKHRKVDLLSS